MVAATTHRGNLFFCVPGHEANCPEEVRKAFGASEKPVTWPPGTTVRVKTLPKERYAQVMFDIIVAASLSWIQGLSPTLKMEWVPYDAEADIRISFQQNVPNWSAIGGNAAKYDKTKPTMNFNFGGWAEYKAIYNHAQIARTAAHLFGHALGIPHAQLTWSSPWNDAALEKQYGRTFADIIKDDKGVAKLQKKESIMRFDRPPEFCSDPATGSGDKQGGFVIDEESRAYLRELYPATLEAEIYHSHTIARPVTMKTTRTANIISGLHLLCFDEVPSKGLTATCHSQNVQPGSSFDLQLYTTDPKAAVEGNTLSFDPADRRAQAGSMMFRNMDQAGPSMSKSRRIDFTRAFDRPPKVVVFIHGVYMDPGPTLRANADVSNIDQKGFDLLMSTWLDDKLRDLGVSWFAHDPDEWTIRSGTYEAPLTKAARNLESTTKLFDKPMVSKPRLMFQGFNHIDMDCGNILTIKMKANEWDEKGVKLDFNSWASGGSNFYCMRGSYIAIL